MTGGKLLNLIRLVKEVNQKTKLMIRFRLIINQLSKSHGVTKQVWSSGLSGGTSGHYSIRFFFVLFLESNVTVALLDGMKSLPLVVFLLPVLIFGKSLRFIPAARMNLLSDGAREQKISATISREMGRELIRFLCFLILRKSKVLWHSIPPAQAGFDSSFLFYF
jgi:hypothetical protein